MLHSLEKNLVNERKFSGDIACLPRVMSLVETACTADAEFAEGIVNSIYFDTPSLAAYSEKANGDNLKTKVRVRWYGNNEDLSNDVPVFIEVKTRLGSARRKFRYDAIAPRSIICEAPFEGCSLQDFISSQLKYLQIPISCDWHPVCQISYNRRRFFDHPTSSRISVDWNIRAPRFNRTIFPWGAPILLTSMVFEFKNQGGIPPLWAKSLQDAGLRFGSFSKYGECMERFITGRIH